MGHQKQKKKKILKYATRPNKVLELDQVTMRWTLLKNPYRRATNRRATLRDSKKPKEQTTWWSGTCLEPVRGAYVSHFQQHIDYREQQKRLDVQLAQRGAIQPVSFLPLTNALSSTKAWAICPQLLFATTCFLPESITLAMVEQNPAELMATCAIEVVERKQMVLLEAEQKAKANAADAADERNRLDEYLKCNDTREAFAQNAFKCDIARTAAAAKRKRVMLLKAEQAAHAAKEANEGQRFQEYLQAGHELPPDKEEDQLRCSARVAPLHGQCRNPRPRRGGPYCPQCNVIWKAFTREKRAIEEAVATENASEVSVFNLVFTSKMFLPPCDDDDDVDPFRPITKTPILRDFVTASRFWRHHELPFVKANFNSLKTWRLWLHRMKCLLAKTKHTGSDVEAAAADVEAARYPSSLSPI